FATLPLPAWLNPWYVVEGLVDPRRSFDGVVQVLVHLVFYLSLGLICVAVSTWSLQRASLRQLEDRPSRWVWAFRASVGDDPVYWREKYVIGLAPLPLLRMIPTWLARLGVFGFAVVLTYTGLRNAIGQSFLYAVQRFDF